MSQITDLVTSSPGAIAGVIGSALLLALLVTNAIWLIRRAVRAEQDSK